MFDVRVSEKCKIFETSFFGLFPFSLNPQTVGEYQSSFARSDPVKRGVIAVRSGTLYRFCGAIGRYIIWEVVTARILAFGVAIGKLKSRDHFCAYCTRKFGYRDSLLS
uniref:Uncharacterized protein n=1 Tax=Bursaphelenchus xylophilus TaxID=6326 RepID=A0A1I7SHE2_BURXY